MKFTSRIRNATWTAGLALAAMPATAGAQSAPALSSFLVTIIGSSSAGPVVGHEILSLQRGEGGAHVAVGGGDGSVTSVPAGFTPDGQIALNTGDPGITCYNMAMAVLARAQVPSADPASVLLRFGNSVVQVPLTVRATQTNGSVRTITLQGLSRGTLTTVGAAVNAEVLVNATVQNNGDGLRGATFDEVQFAGTLDQIVGHSTCVLSRRSTAATLRT